MFISYLILYSHNNNDHKIYTFHLILTALLTAVLSSLMNLLDYVVNVIIKVFRSNLLCYHFYDGGQNKRKNHHITKHYFPAYFFLQFKPRTEQNDPLNCASDWLVVTAVVG